MMLPKIVFIEGVPGCGKSTLGARLTAGLNARGCAASFYHEHDPAHPVMPPGEPGAMYDPARRIARWTDFIDHASAKTEVVILESSLFQRQTNAYVGALAEAAAESMVGPIYKTIERTPIALIYFKQDDMQRHFAWLEVARPGALEHFTALLAGTPFARKLRADPFELVTSYFKRVQDFTTPFAERFPGARCFVDGSQKDWISQDKSVSSFMGLDLGLFSQETEPTGTL